MPPRVAPAQPEPWKRLSAEERKQQLIEIAEDLFVSRPYCEIGVGDIAKAAGISHGLIYHYFPSKEALLAATFEDRAAKLLAAADPLPGAALAERIAAGVRGYLDFVEAHRVAFVNLFRNPTADQPELLRICEQTRMALVQKFLDGIPLQDKRLPATRISLRGYVGAAEAIGAQWLQEREPSRAKIEQLITVALVSAVLAGVSVDRGPDSPELTAVSELVSGLVRAPAA